MTAQGVMEKLRAADSDKGVGNYAAVVLLEQDPMLTRLVSVFPNVALPPLPLATAAPPAIPEGKLVRWLWSLLEPEPLTAWLEMAGLPDAAHTRRACQVAIDNRMVLPDGTVARFAAQYIRSLVGGTLARRGVKETGSNDADAQLRVERAENKRLRDALAAKTAAAPAKAP